MNYKIILFGMMLLLTLPTAASARHKKFSTKASGTQCNNGSPSTCSKTKSSPTTDIDDDDPDLETTMQIIFDPLGSNNATLQKTDSFATGPSTGAFTFLQDDGPDSNFGVFTGTYKTTAGSITSFTGTLVMIFADGTFEVLKIKSAKEIP